MPHGGDAMSKKHATKNPILFDLRSTFVQGYANVAMFNKAFPQISYKMSVNGRPARSRVCSNYLFVEEAQQFYFTFYLTFISLRQFHGYQGIARL